MRYTNKKILKITFPVLVCLLMEQLIGLTDTAYLGRVGEAELGASALAGIFYLMIFMLGFGFSIGAQILIARRNGAKEYSQIGPLFMQSTAFLLLMALVLFILSKVFVARIMGTLIEAPDVREAAVRYLDYRVYGFFFAYVGSMFRAFYVGTTRTRILTINSIVMVLTNVVLNYLLIFGKFGFPEMGIAGAAIASSISEGVSALFYILYTRYRTDWRRYKFRFTGFDFSLPKQILSLSVWVMIQQGVAFLAWFLFFLCIEHLGKRDLAATNIVRAVSSLIFMFINAFASTASSLVSNLIGAGYTEQIMPLCRKMIRLCFCFVLPLCILAAAIPYWTLRIYTDDVSLIEYAIPSLWVMLTTNIPCTAAFIYQFSVSGTGNTRTALTIVACTSIVYVAYTALLVYGLHADVALCWTADHVYYGCTLTASYLYMRYGNWRARKI